MKYVDTMVTFEEFPDEISLCINISNCPFRCKGCHSPHLQQDIGKELNEESLSELIEKNRGITCVGFMGGDANAENVWKLCKFINDKYPKLKVGWYSGRDYIPPEAKYFDYVKYGPYIENRGPLNSRTTNQRMVMYNNPRPGTQIVSAWYMMDVTHWFWRDRV